MNILRTIDWKRAVIALVASAGFLGTRAFFSDTETSVGNVFAAGSLDLMVGIQGAGSENDFAPQSIPGNQALFKFENLIPGSTAAGYFRLESTQDAWACIAAEVTGGNENSHLDAEQEAGDNTTVQGELQNYMEIAIWEANGDANADGVVGTGERETLQVMSLEDFANNDYYTLQDSSTNGGDNPLLANDEGRHEFAYCFGEFSNVADVQANGGTLECDGSSAGNDAQTDSAEMTIHFYAEQMQNNPNFVCSSVSGTGGGSTPGGVVAGASLASTYDAPTSCDATVQSGESIQDAIDIAAAGDTICVDQGTYEPFVADKAVTVVGLNSPAGANAAIVTGSTGTETSLVLVNAGSVTIKGLRVQGGSYSTQFAGIGVINDTDNIGNITIDSNVVQDMNASAQSIKGIQVFADENAANRISNVTITNNMIDDLTGAKGAYGVQIVNEVAGIEVTNNTISDFSGSWGAGVAVDGNNPSAPTGVVITNNQITDHASGGTHFSVQVEVNAQSDEVSVNYNNLKDLLHGGSSGNPAGEALDAENNWWGDTDPSNDVVNAPASNTTDYTPFASSAYSN